MGRVRLLSEEGTFGGRRRRSGRSSRYDSHCRQRKPIHRTSPPTRVLCSHLFLCTLAVHLRGRKVPLRVGRYVGSHNTHHLYKHCSQLEGPGLVGRSFPQSVRGTAGFHSKSAVHSTGLRIPHQHRKSCHRSDQSHHKRCMAFDWSSLALGRKVH